MEKLVRMSLAGDRRYGSIIEESRIKSKGKIFVMMNQVAPDESIT
jgi:hypothetical protein